MSDNLVHRNNSIDYLELTAADAAQLAVTQQFYSSAFGWKYKEWAPEYADTQDSGITSGLSAHEGDRLKTPLPVIYVNELEDARTKIVASGGKIQKDIYAFPGGRRFHFVDPAGNQLAVWSEK
ncbi:MAG TPA: VOC family protein [Steroidobacteraceae bacterium]|nr:VOC family protein [Steroidobacteraceae bacterium]